MLYELFGMFKLLSGRNCFWGYHAKQNFLRRWFLSDAYECSEAWQNRLKSPAFTKIDFENVYHQMDLKFKQNKAVRVLDIDLFVNSLTDIQYVNEVEDILIKLRQNPECTLLPERTTHALLRLYLNNALKENLFMVLSNRMMFGVFPDYYLSNLMMNKFLKADDALSAAKVAVLLMLQEEWESPITKIFALYSCYAYLKSSQIWEIVESKIPEAEDEDEVRKVRVKFIRNPYFDDHFDLNVPNHLIGKTLWMFGLTLDEPIGVSSQLVGLVLYEKFEKCFVLLQDIIKQNTKLYSEAVVKAKDYIQNPPKQKVVEVSEENKNEQQKDEQVEAGSNKATDQWKNKVLELLEKLDNTNLKEGNMLNDLETKLKEVIEKNQGNDIEVQCKIYQQWEKDRQEHIQNELDKSALEKLQKEIAKVKSSLQTEEQKLFYFDNEEEILMKVSEVRKRKKSLKFFKGKRKDRENNESVYIPPTVSRKSDR